MRWLRSVLRWVPLDDHRRRAIVETIADGCHEWRSAGVGRRLRALPLAVVGLLRLAGASGLFASNPLRSLGRDARYAARRLRAAPLFSVFAIVSLALAIGAATAVYALALSVTRPPPGVQRLERIVNVYSGGGVGRAISWPDFRDFRDRQTMFDSVTAWGSFPASLATPNGATSETGEVVDGNFFEVLGVQPVLGRPLQPADDAPGAPLVAVISHRMWERHYAGSPDAIGRDLLVNGQAFQIVGIAPHEFRGLGNSGLSLTAVWVPLSSVEVLGRPNLVMTLDPAQGDRRWLLVKGLGQGGANLEGLRSEVEAFGAALDATRPLPARDGRRPRARGWTVVPMADVTFENDASIVNGLIAALMSAVGIVLLVACTNLANLALARGSARRQEVVLRYALGASRWRQFRERVLESAMLVSVAWGASLVVARGILSSVAGDIPVSGTSVLLSLDPRLDVSAVGVSVIAGLLALATFGVVPAIIATRSGRTAVPAPDVGHATPRWRGRRALIVGQVMASVVLLSVAGLAVQELRRQANYDPGLDVDRLVVAEVHFDAQGYDAIRTRQLLDRVRTLVARQPEVSSLAIASGLPAVTTTDTGRFTVPGGSREWGGSVVAGSPELLSTIGVRLLHGRAWTATDPVGGRGVAVISASTARTMFGGVNVVGRTMYARPSGGQMPSELTIVGIAEDTDVGFYGRREGSVIYVPFDQAPSVMSSLLVVRTEGNPAVIVPLVRQAFSAVDPTLAIYQVDTGRYLHSATALFFSIVAGIATLLGTFAWVLALAGLYGVLAHVVQLRTREIGLRVALGARREQILGMVVREGLRPAGVGIAGGLALGVIARLALQPQLQGLVPSFDWLTLVLGPVLFLAAAWLACYLPARRAAGVDPNIALRSS